MAQVNFALLSRLVLHVVVCLAFPIFSYLGFTLYGHLSDVPIDRGVNLGLAMWLIFCVFIVVNFIMIGVGSFRAKTVMAAMLSAMVFIYLVADSPLRAIGFAILSGALPFFAIYFSAGVQHWLEVRFQKAM